jgi:thiamine transporter ThiT
MNVEEKMKLRFVPYKQIVTIVCVVVFLSVIDFLFIQPGRYWRGGACAICVYLFRAGQWIPLAIGVLTPLLPKSCHLSPGFVVFEYVFAVIYSGVYAEKFLHGIAWTGPQSDAAFVSAFWVFWLTCGIAIGSLIKYWRTACLYSK